MIPVKFHGLSARLSAILSGLLFGSICFFFYSDLFIAERLVIRFDLSPKPRKLQILEEAGKAGQAGHKCFNFCLSHSHELAVLRQACVTIAKQGQQAQPLSNPLLKLLKSERAKKNPRIAALALHTLGIIHNDEKVLWKRHLEALKNDHAVLRRAALSSMLAMLQRKTKSSHPKPYLNFSHEIKAFLEKLSHSDQALTSSQIVEKRLAKEILALVDKRQQ